jgi:hypothetical protein
LTAPYKGFPVLSLSEIEFSSSTEGRLFSVTSAADQERVRIFESEDGYSFYWPAAKKPLDQVAVDLLRTAASSVKAGSDGVQMYLAFADGSHADLKLRMPLLPARLRFRGKKVPTFVRMDTPTLRVAVDLPGAESSEALFAMQALKPLTNRALRLVPSLFARNSALAPAEALAVARELRSDLPSLIRQYLLTPSGTATL